MKAGANTASRDFHARTIRATPDRGHDEKALSENLFQPIRSSTALAKKQS
jgi:hypothetical protein